LGRLERLSNLDGSELYGKKMTDDKTPMERFDDLLSRTWKKRPKAAEADAEEVMEGGIAPTGEAAEGDE
jgi:hypothetical protein